MALAKSPTRSKCRVGKNAWGWIVETWKSYPHVTSTALGKLARSSRLTLSEATKLVNLCKECSVLGKKLIEEDFWKAFNAS